MSAMDIAGEITREQVLAFRARRQGLTQRRGLTALVAVASVCGVQDTPPGNADVSLAARLQVHEPVAAKAVAEGRLVLTWSLRGAPHLLAPVDLAVFTLGALPAPGTRAALWRQPEDALEVVEEAMFSALASPMSKGELSTAVTQSVAPEYAPYCRGCDVHHPSESIFRAAPLLGRIVLTSTAPVLLARAATAGVAPSGMTDGLADLQAELLRRYLRVYAPTTPAHFADWAGIARSDAKQRWTALAEGLVRVGNGFALEEDVEDLRDGAPAEGVRLLPAKDAWLQARDRDLLFPTKADRGDVYKTIGGPGVVLAGGQPVGVWRAAAKGRRLTIRWRPFDGWMHVDLDDEAQRVAEARGLADAVVVAWD